MKLALLASSLLGLLSLSLALPADDIHEVKIGRGPGAPHAAPAPAPPPRPPPPPAARPPPSTCNGIRGGNACVTCAKKNQCAFNTATNLCVERNAAPNLITDHTKCQQHGATPSENIKNRANELWARMRSHVLTGEPGSDSDSGRHTFSSYRSDNKDAGRCDTQTHLCAFRLKARTPKTVWDDREHRYSEGDIETICKTAITLNIRDTGGIPRGDAAFVVQTKYGAPICVRHQVSGSGSCYPLGLHKRSNRLGDECRGGPQDLAPAQGRNEEIPALS